MVDGAGTEVVLISSSPEVLAHHSPCQTRSKDERIPFVSLCPHRYSHNTLHALEYSFSGIPILLISFLLSFFFSDEISRISLSWQKKNKRGIDRSRWWKSCRSNPTLDRDLSRLVRGGLMLSMTGMWANNNIRLTRVAQTAAFALNLPLNHFKFFKLFFPFLISFFLRQTVFEIRTRKKNFAKLCSQNV